MKLIDSSGIRKVFDLASKMKDPINLSIGQPDFDTPEDIKQSAIRAISEGKNKYTLTQGLKELNQKLLEKYRSQYPKNPPESIFISSGVSGGLLLACMALIDPGDEVLISDPYFVMYKHLVNLMGGKPVFYDLYPDFKIKREALEKKITDRTKLIIINSPNNPTGIVHTREEIRIVAELAEENDIFIISDEIYDSYVYNNDYTSILDFTNNALVMKGFSKNYSITGWRMGAVMGPDEVISQMITLQQYTFVCAPAPFQYAVLENLDSDLTKYRDEYQKKRDTIYEGLKEKFDIVKPEGAFYIFPKAPDGKASEFVEKAIAKNLLIIPGNVFSEKDTHFRIAYTADIKTLQRGAEILNSLV